MGGGDHGWYRCGLPGRSQSRFEFLCSAKARLRRERGTVEVVEVVGMLGSSLSIGHDLV